MFKTILRISVIVAIASAAATINGAPSPQSGFTIVNGSDNNQTHAAPVSLPALGFVLDNSQRLHPVLGVVGSASIGAPLELGFDVVRAAVPPGHEYILASASGSDWPQLLQIRGNTITVWPLNAFVNAQNPLAAALTTATVDGMVLSFTGSAAALFSESQRRIIAFTNMSQSPTLAGTFEFGEPGSVSAFGISDDGMTVAVGISDGNAGSLFLQKLGQPARLIASMRHPSAITFLHRSDNAVVADDVDNTIYALSGGQVFSVATADAGISGPVAIASSNDNGRVFVGNSQTGSVITLGASGPIGGPQYCNCTLSTLQPLNVDSVFRLTDFSGGPVVLLNASGVSPRMIFVPVKGSQF